MQCFRCLHNGDPATHCTKTFTNTTSEKQSDGDKYNLIKSSKSTKTIKVVSKTKLRNSRIKMKRSFTTLNTRIEEMEN